MKRLLPILLLCACGGSLVDHNNPALTRGGGSPCADGTFKTASGCQSATSLSAGTSHTCAVAGGEAHCWGANDQGQLGNAGGSSFVPVQAALTGAVSAVAAGSSHTCAIADGDVWCWGDNTYGQLGSGIVGGPNPTPQKVANFSGVSLLAAGGAHTCAVNGTGMLCWGRNNYGQLGNGAPAAEAPRPDPTPVVGLASAISIAAGDGHTCAVIASGGVYCWGNNGAGQLGINQPPGWYSSPTLISSSALNGTSFVGLGANHSCAGASSNTLYCWGANSVYQVDSSGQDQKSPRQGPMSARAVAGGTGHTCAIANDGSLKCWGLDDQGQLGVISAGTGAVDVALTSVTAIAAGNKHTCAIAGGNTLCWGLNDRGQLGADPASTPSTSTPSLVSGR